MRGRAIFQNLSIAPGWIGKFAISMPTAVRDTVDKITQVIETSIDPDAWQDKSGTDIITELGGRLIITTSRENHLRIGTLLQGLRKPGESAPYTTAPR